MKKKTATKLKKLVIDRAKWARGTNSLLLDTYTGAMCCLGFLGRKCGLKKFDIKDVGEPDGTFGINSIKEKSTKWPKGVLNEDLCDTPWTCTAISLNDNEEITDAKREKELIKHFKEIGYEVSFVGKDIK